jgi:hypothetical protein
MSICLVGCAITVPIIGGAIEFVIIPDGIIFGVGCTEGKAAGGHETFVIPEGLKLKFGAMVLTIGTFGNGKG